jgi:hypothetical protein
MIEHGRKSRQVLEKFGGASRDRTDDLIVANDGVPHSAPVSMRVSEPFTFQNVPMAAKPQGLPGELPQQSFRLIPRVADVRTRARTVGPNPPTGECFTVNIILAVGQLDAKLAAAPR